MSGRYVDPLLGIDIPTHPGMIIPLFRNGVIETSDGQRFQVTDGDTILVKNDNSNRSRGRIIRYQHPRKA